MGILRMRDSRKVTSSMLRYAAWQLASCNASGEPGLMPVQDDSREQQMIALFNLIVPPERARADVDAHLKLPELDGPMPFELKSTTGNSVSTVRDFGPEHIAKWRDLHWLFAFYLKDGFTLRYCYYASPADMRDWIADKEDYIRPDMVLAGQVQEFVGDSTLSAVLGDDESYGIEDARSIMKAQWKTSDYQANADLEDGRYSRSRMIWLLQARLAYVIRRGSTLNNPHISESYFIDKGLQPITEDHAATVRSLVRGYLAKGPSIQPVDLAVAVQARAAATADPTA